MQDLPGSDPRGIRFRIDPTWIIIVKMPKIAVTTLNAFARTPGSGNPAGVMLDADRLDESSMQEIAAQAGLSETAFVQKSVAADFKIRFFTPAAATDF